MNAEQRRGGSDGGADGPGPCTIRVATPADAQLLAGLAERCFRESWAHHNLPADMDAYCAAHFATACVEADLVRPAVRYLLATCAADAVGYLRVEAGATHECVAAAAPLEISRVYALRRWHGRGVGPALMATCLRDAAAAGHDVAWLAVWQRAPQALAFYRKWGFRIVGTTAFTLGRSVQDDFVMARACGITAA
jgi:GNAT superfamily N-acetyltransferase